MTRNTWPHENVKVEVRSKRFKKTRKIFQRLEYKNGFMEFGDESAVTMVNGHEEKLG